MFPRADMMNLMNGAGGYNMASYGMGLVGGGLPKALKEQLRQDYPKYKSRSEKSRTTLAANIASGKIAPPPKKGTAEAKARGQKAAATRRASNVLAAQATIAQAKAGGVSNLSDMHEMYLINRLNISRYNTSVKGKEYREKKAATERKEAYVRPEPSPFEFPQARLQRSYLEPVSRGKKS